MAQHYPRLPVKGPVVIPNCVQVGFLWQVGTTSFQYCSNQLHGQYSGASLAGTEAQAIATALVANTFFTTWLSHVHPSWAIRGIHVKDLRQRNLPTWEYLYPTAHPGTSTGFPLSASSSLVISLRTANSGKGYFGRIYAMGITQDNLADARHFAATISTPALNFADAMRSAMAGSNFTWGVGQRALAANTDPAAPPNQQQARPANIIPIISTKLTDLRIDNQRRRLGKPGS